MRIAWATPVDARSAIGRVSVDVVRALVGSGHRVRVIATDMDAAEVNHPFAAEVVSWRRCDPASLARDHDVLVAQVGDHYLYHGGLFALLGVLPTVGIFHDFYLYDLFNGWLWDGGQRPEAARATLHADVVGSVYGDAVAPMAAAAAEGRLDLADIAKQMPMTEWIARSCHGALAHAEFYLDRLAAGCPGPVARAAMPVTSRGIPPLRARPEGPVTLLTVGVMNPNKCADRVITALAGDPELRDRTIYRLVGPIEADARDRLEALARSLGYPGLEIHGPVSDSDLEAHLNEAEVIVCLRDPVLEGSSGSAIEAMLAGRPLVVADAGFYRELPNDIAFKVASDIPIDGLRALLARLVADHTLRLQAGAAARRWAEARFDLAAYGEAVVGLAKDTVKASASLAVAEQFGRRLRDIGLKPTDPAAARIAAALSELLPVR